MRLLSVSLITQLQTFEKNASDFDMAQGGIFGAASTMN